MSSQTQVAAAIQVALTAVNVLVGRFAYTYRAEYSATTNPPSALLNYQRASIIHARLRGLAASLGILLAWGGAGALELLQATTSLQTASATILGADPDELEPSLSDAQLMTAANGLTLPSPYEREASHDAIYVVVGQIATAQHQLVSGLAAMLTSTPPPAPAAVTAASVETVSVPLPKDLTGTEPAALRVWALQLEDAVAARATQYRVAGALGAAIMSTLTPNSPAAAAYFASPPPPNTLASNADVMAALRTIIDMMVDRFGESDDEIRRAAERRYLSLKQGGDRFGAFYAKYTQAVEESGRHLGSDESYADLRSKTLKAILERIEESEDVTGARLAYGPFVEAARRLDGSVGEKARRAFAAAHKEKGAAHPLAPAKATIEVMARNVKWQWPDDIPRADRGPLGPPGSALRVRLAEENKCYYCRRVGHQAGDCAEARGTRQHARVVPGQVPEALVGTVVEALD